MLLLAIASPSLNPAATPAPSRAALVEAIPYTCGGCSGHGTCADGRHCTCAVGWSGEQCSVDTCPQHCAGRGVCLLGRCSCYDGFEGEDCTLETGVPMSEPYQRCSGHGQLKGGKCECFEYWQGEFCELNTCPLQCSGHGACSEGVCTCDEGWKGSGCEDRRCPGEPECSSHGACDAATGVCACDFGWLANDCTVPSCPKGCSNHGYCLGRICTCAEGWGGLACDAPPPEHVAIAEHPNPNATYAASKQCANDCSGRGRCLSGECRCRPGYTGPPGVPNDCSLIQRPRWSESTASPPVLPHAPMRPACCLP